MSSTEKERKVVDGQFKNMAAGHAQPLELFVGEFPTPQAFRTARRPGYAKLKLVRTSQGKLVMVCDNDTDDSVPVVYDLSVEQIEVLAKVFRSVAATYKPLSKTSKSDSKPS